MKSYIEKNEINEWLVKLDKALAEGVRSKGFVEQVKKLASLPKRKRIKVNLRKLDSIAKEGEHIIVPGKVLGVGEVRKKFNISAIEYSHSAVEKLRKSGCNIIGIDEALKAKDSRIII
ncbi:MAG: uL15 family ribosomal protein [Candidatus Micrarchaeia archaeon]|jgi:large subunit ribosomal protein L18e